MRSLVRFRFLLLVPVVLLATSFKTSDNYTITVEIRGAMSINEYTIYTIKGNSHKASIHLYNVDGVNFPKMFLDTAYKNYIANEKTDTSFAGSKTRVKKYQSLIKKYSFINQRDIGINAKTSPMYFKQIDSLLHTDEKVLLYQSPNRGGVMDGYAAGFSINNNGVKRGFMVVNPDGDYAAPLYRFLISTWAFFNPKKNNPQKKPDSTGSIHFN